MAEEKKEVPKKELEKPDKRSSYDGPAKCPNCGSTNCRSSRDNYPMIQCMCCGHEFWRS